MALTVRVGALRSVPPDQSQLVLENGEASITKRVTEGDFLGYVQVVTDKSNARQLFGALLTVSVVAALLTTVALSTADTDVQERAQPSRIGTTVPAPAAPPTPSTSNAGPPTTQSGASNAGPPTQSGAGSATPGAVSTVTPAAATPPPVSPGSVEEDVSPPPSGSRVAAAGDTEASGPEPAAVAATTWTAPSGDPVGITPAVASASTPVASASSLVEPGVSVGPVPTTIRATSMLSTVDAPIDDLVVVTATSGIVAAGPDTRAAGTTSAADVILDTTSAAETNTVADPTRPSGDTTAQDEDPAGSVPVDAAAADAPSSPTGEAETAGMGEAAAGSSTTADTSVPGTTATDVGGTESAPEADGSPTDLPGSTP